MIDLWRPNLNSPGGKLIKSLADRLVSMGMILPILSGPARGMKWIASSSNHSCWLGNYEAGKSKVMQGLVKPGMTVYDVGAHVGYYSLIFAKLVGPGGKVYAFEPLGENCAILGRHLRLNNLGNVILNEFAVGDADAEVLFYPNESNYMGKIVLDDAVAETGEPYTITAISLDNFVYARGNPAPEFIKMDIEGAEYLACLGMERLLTEQKPVFFLALHGAEVSKHCLEVLRKWQYDIFDLDGVRLNDGDEYHCEVMALPVGRKP